MKKQFFALFALFVLFTFAPIPTFASPLINEFSSGTSDDWVEIFNPGPDEVDLSLYRIRDLTANNKLDLSGSLSAGGFAAYEWSNKLNNSGDLIKLILISDESIIDQTSYGDQGGISAPSSTQTGGRQADGGQVWVIFEASSKNSSNNSSTVFSSPTPTPSKTPTPTKSPTPSKTPTPTKSSSQSVQNSSKSPTPTKIIISTSLEKTASTKINLTKNNISAKIASNFASVRNVSPSPSQKMEKVAGVAAADQKFSVFIALGGLICLIAAAWFARALIKEIALNLYEKIFDKGEYRN